MGECRLLLRLLVLVLVGALARAAAATTTRRGLGLRRSNVPSLPRGGAATMWEMRGPRQVRAASPAISRSAEMAAELNRQKLFGSWSGSALDFFKGVGIGSCAGWLFGIAFKGAVSGAAFVISQTAVTLLVAKISTSLGIISIHWGRLNELMEKFLFVVPKGLKSDLLSPFHGHMTKKDLARDVKSLRHMAGKNEHLAGGLLAGAGCGFLKSIGLI